MALVINTNLASLNAQRNISGTQRTLSTSLQRLSSGIRINSAKDDAAGLYSAERMTSTIRGMDQATRNAADGISLAQTAEGALGQISANLQRIREIAVQSANGTVEDRTGLQSEVNQLTQEISRIIQTTEFNGTSLLSGSNTLTFQVGADGVTSNQIQVTTTDLTAPTPSTVYTAALSMASLISTYAISGATDDSLFHNSSSPAYQAFQAEISGYGAGPEATAAQAVYTAAHIAYIASPGYPGPDDNSNAAAIAAADAQAATYMPGTGVFNSYNSDLGADGTIDVSSSSSASTALTSLDADINLVSSTRATFGAIQNRFEAVIANLSNTSENLTAAKSRIVDADFAAETAQMTRSQILQQAGVSMLAQANSLPQLALGLLSR